jgi:hypothetical protein
MCIRDRDSEGYSSLLTAGLDPEATNGIDRSLGESELPPNPPEGVFYAKFVAPDSNYSFGNGLLMDLRPGIWGENTQLHKIEFQSSTGMSKDITLVWNLHWAVSGQIKDEYDLFTIPMQGSGSLNVPYNGLRALFITFYYNVTIGVEDDNPEQIKDYALLQNYPNPFNPSTQISFELPKDGNVTLKVYDVLGKEAAVLENGYKRAGKYTVNFNASNLAAGIYLYQLRAGNSVITKKMSLVK